MFAWIILFGLLAPVVFILTSWIMAKSGKFENKFVRTSAPLMCLFLMIMFLVVPFVPQPRLANTYLRFAVGIPLAVFGMAFRMSPPIYWEKMKTRQGVVRSPKWVLAAHGPAYFITSGPYSIVRQPQYVGSIIFMIGWFLIWGGLYTFYILPVLIIHILVWALIEEKYILEREFGDEYREYKKKVGMFFPKIRR